MNNTLAVKIAVGVTASTALVVGYLALSKNATLEQLYEAYPDLDPKVAKKAYNRLMSIALRGKIDMAHWSEEQFNNLFMQEVARLSTEK